MMNLPQANVVKMEYRSVGPRLTADVLRIHMHTHMDTVEHFDLPNGNWTVNNPTLQFMALQDFRPSDFDARGRLDPEGITLVPIAPLKDGWGLAEIALQGGEQALRNAEWFDGPKVMDGDETDTAPPGGGSPDPGTGNRGGVEDPSEDDADSGVGVEMADDEDDAGVEVTVE